MTGGDKITQEELKILFGDTIPIEAVNILFDSPDDMTIGEAREKIRAFAKQKDEVIEREIGRIGNYYGGLHVKSENGRCFWSIENYSGHNWEEIPRSLFYELWRFEDLRQQSRRSIEERSDERSLHKETLA